MGLCPQKIRRLIHVMATKTAEKKTTKKAAAPAAATSARRLDPMEALAGEVLRMSQLHRVLVRLGEPARVPEIVREIGDDAVTTALARQAMASDRAALSPWTGAGTSPSGTWTSSGPRSGRWKSWSPTTASRCPSPAPPGNWPTSTGAPREHFDEVAPRLLRGAHFFPVADGLAYGLRSWLLDVSSDKERDVLFYNYLSAPLLAPFEAAAAEADWEADPLGSASRLLAVANGLPVDNRLIQFFAWRALGEDFDAVALYDQMHAQGDVLLALPDHRWLPADDSGAGARPLARAGRAGRRTGPRRAGRRGRGRRVRPAAGTVRRGHGGHHRPL